MTDVISHTQRGSKAKVKANRVQILAKVLSWLEESQCRTMSSRGGQRRKSGLCLCSYEDTNPMPLSTSTCSKRPPQPSPFIIRLTMCKFGAKSTPLITGAVVTLHVHTDWFSGSHTYPSFPGKKTALLFLAMREQKIKSHVREARAPLHTAAPHLHLI